jgi:2-polyprenyl-6-methoxyphenol hydroxylase-like FAD-dependent oxidoreductase
VDQVDYIIVGQGLAGSLLACLLRMHPENKRIAIFNGLGSKGALQGPFAAVQLIGYLERNQAIHPEFDVCRKSLWQRPRSD